MLFRVARRKSLAADPVGFGHELVDVPSDRFSLRVAEELFRRRVPGRDVVLEIDGGDRRRAYLKERLEVLLPALPFPAGVAAPLASRAAFASRRNSFFSRPTRSGHATMPIASSRSKRV